MSGPPAPAVAAELQRRYPGVRAWRGNATKEWWAYVPRTRRQRPELVAAATPKLLDEAIRAALGWRS